MDREPAIIRAEMNQTRAELGRKIGLLEARARELTPARLSAQYVPDYMLERTIGAVLTLIGVRMAWSVLAKRAQAGTRSGRAGVVRQR